MDTGIFAEDRFWVVEVEWAKAGPEDLLWRITVRNAGPDEATIDVLPTVWFRNLWSWRPGGHKPVIRLAASGPDGPTLVAQQHQLGKWALRATGPVPGDALFCDNETNAASLWGAADSPAFPKDGIAEHVITGAATVNPAHEGTKAALRYHLTVPAGGEAEIRLRFSSAPDQPEQVAEMAAASAAAPGGDAGVAGAGDVAEGVGGDFGEVLAARRAEADEFYDSLAPLDATDDERSVMRQAFAGMIWGKQFFHYDVERWLQGDESQPPPPESRQRGRNSGWAHLNNHDVISMPDAWEYPWYAAWDLAFHCVALAHLDPEFAKSQLILLGREWYMHPNGQLPAYEWSFDDVNPPVQAWAALRVFEIDAAARTARGEEGPGDLAFLERIFHKLVLNFTWWVNRKDAEGINVFEGGFLGLDNIGLFDRSKPLPVAGRLEQSDGTAWMAMYCLNLLEIALTLAAHDGVYEDVATKFFEHFTYIASATRTQGLWDEEDGFFYDVLHLQDGTDLPIRAISMVGLVSLFAVTSARCHDAGAPTAVCRPDAVVPRQQAGLRQLRRPHRRSPGERCPAAVGRQPDHLRRILSRVLDEAELLSPYGLRSLSRRHGEQPVTLDLGGVVSMLDYEPAESTNYLFGGNSNWRGPGVVPAELPADRGAGPFRLQSR